MGPQGIRAGREHRKATQEKQGSQETSYNLEQPQAAASKETQKEAEAPDTRRSQQQPQ